MKLLPPQTGTAFLLKKGEKLKVIDPEGEQVADLLCYSFQDPAEFLSSGRSIDYNETIYLTQGHTLYSNRSQPMLEIIHDDVGRHDFLLTPCSLEMFRLFHKVEGYHPNCFDNLADALAPFGIGKDHIPTTFNIFMHVVPAENGQLHILPPQSQKGDTIVFLAKMDLIIGLTACSDEQTNHGTLKSIGFEIEEGTFFGSQGQKKASFF